MIVKGQAITKKIKVLKQLPNQDDEVIELQSDKDLADAVVLNKPYSYRLSIFNSKNNFFDNDRRVVQAFIDLHTKYDEYIEYKNVVPVVFYKDAEQTHLQNILGDKKWNLSSYTFYFYDGKHVYCVISQFNSICFLDKRIHSLDAVATVAMIRETNSSDDDPVVVMALEGYPLIENMTKLVDWTVDNTDELLDHMYSTTGNYTDINTINLEDDSEENIKRIEKAIFVTPHNVMAPEKIENYVARLADITRKVMTSGMFNTDSNFYDDIPEFILEFFELVLKEQRKYKFFLESKNSDEVLQMQNAWVKDYSIINNAEELIMELTRSTLIIKVV